MTYARRMKPMEKLIMAILENAAVLSRYEEALELREEFHLKVEVNGYMPLTIEVTPAGEVSVAHYFTQNGDAMRDPEIVFYADTWHSAEITQDPVGVFQRASDGRYLPGADSLANAWAKNLRWQGFTGKDVKFSGKSY